MPMHNKAQHALKVAQTCGFCGGVVEESRLNGGHYCTSCHVTYDSKNSNLRGDVYEFDILHEPQELHCALCKLPIGKIYAKQKPPEIPSPMPTGALYDYADPNVQKMLAFRYKEHKGNCSVRMNF